MKRAKRTIVILGLALAGCRAPILAPTYTPEVFSVRILATTTTHRLLQDLANGYSSFGVHLALDTDTANWQAVSAQLLADDAPFALTAYLPVDAPLWAAPVGYDGLAIIVAANNGVQSLTMDQIRRIFQGRITSWDELGGTALPITVISRETGADTRHVFDDQVMTGRRVVQGAQLALSSASVVEIVARTPGAIGYTSLALLDARVRPLALVTEAGTGPVRPSAENIASGRYPLVMPVYVVGHTAPRTGTPAYDWFAWMQSESGQEIISRHYSPLSAANRAS